MQQQLLSTFWRRPLMPRYMLTLAVAALLTLMLNQAFVTNILAWGSAAELIPLTVLLLLINLLICQLFSIGKLQKPWLLLLLTVAASSQYFMQHYGVLIDRSMLQNALETDSHEIAGLLNSAMLPYFTTYLLLPAVLLLWTKANSVTLSAKHYAVMLLLPLLLIGILSVSQYQTFAPTLRQHRELKHLATPFNGLNATIGLIKKALTQDIRPPFSPFAQDAHIVSNSAKPQLVIMVLGETLRADHLSINGYARNTTPHLAQLELLNLGAISSCGTATAISVPCMFSYLNHDSYDETVAKNSDNLLDVMQRAGVKVLWRDNNSGCKGMCDRIEVDHSFLTNNDLNCSAGSCPDSVLLSGLKQKILTEFRHQQSIFIVLHQQGNHGPEYFKRSVASQKQFLPECETNLLNECRQQDIINAYDNAIVATDELLNDTIKLLETLSDEFDTSMLYVSDHGESLGENGVYLHGLPYWMAPDAQTKVPMLMWFSPPVVNNSMLNTACIRNNALQINSHDMLFDSMLDLMQVASSQIRPQQDIFHGCRDLAQRLENSNQGT